MNAILVLLRKDFSLLFKDRISIAITFVVPFALIYLFGQVFHLNSSEPGPSGLPLAVVMQSDSLAAGKLLAALKAERTFKVLTEFVGPGESTRPLTEADLRPMMRADAFRFALVIPKDLIRTDGLGLHLRSYSNPRNAVEAETVSGMLQKVIFSNLPELLGPALQARARAAVGNERLERFNASIASSVAGTFGGDPAALRARLAGGDFGFPERGAASPTPGSGALARLVKLDTIQVAGAGIKSPAATLLVGGWAMQFLLFALTSSATALFREKDLGIFQRVLCAPVSRGDILWSKFLYGICLGLVQLVVLFLAGHLLYGIEIGAQLGPLVVVCLFAAASCTAFGMLIASLAPTPQSAQGIATFVILLMCAIGGAWFPVSFMPEFIQRFSRFTLVYWSMEGFSQVLWAHATLGELLPTLGRLSLITALVMGVAVWRFRKGRIFE